MSQNIEGAIHSWWADGTIPAAVALNALLPVARVFTGDKQIEESTFSPFAKINREGEPGANYTNCGRRDDVLIRLTIWHENEASGKAIADAAVACFDNQGRPPAIETIRKSNRFHIQEDDGVWQFVIDFLVNSNA